METLSQREKEVLKFVAWGASAKEIGNLLQISTYTVQNHIRRIKEKTKVQKITELSAYYFCQTYNLPDTDSPLKKV